MKKVYMKVTMDKYELPLAVADSAKELAEICGTTVNNINSCCSKYKTGKHKKSSFISVEVEE